MTDERKKENVPNKALGMEFLCQKPLGRLQLMHVETKSSVLRIKTLDLYLYMQLWLKRLSFSTHVS